jgi:predicted nucleic acid-binding protein
VSGKFVVDNSIVMAWVEQEPADRVFAGVIALARETNLSSYDASYLDLAMRAGAPLATQEKSLRHAAKRCGVALV